MIFLDLIKIKRDLYQGPEHGLADNKYKAPDIIGNVVDVCNWNFGSIRFYNLHQIIYIRTDFDKKNGHSKYKAPENVFDVCNKFWIDVGYLN